MSMDLDSSYPWIDAAIRNKRAICSPFFLSVAARARPLDVISISISILDGRRAGISAEVQ